MAWSTRQLADLAGTTIKTVRHYHEIGLLEEPDRAPNGYKQYRTADLVRLLQIKRLSELGVPLSQIATMGRAADEPDEAIGVLDAELQVTIERLQRIRGELAIILRHRATVDVPTGFSHVRGLSEPDRALIMIYSRVFDQEAMEELREIAQTHHATDDEFTALPADASAEAIEELADRMAPVIARIRAEHPWTADPGAVALRGAEFAREVVTQALAELYNPAQLKVLAHVNHILDHAPGQSPD